MPGFGESQEPKEPIGSFEYAEIVKEFMHTQRNKKDSFRWTFLWWKDEDEATSLYMGEIMEKEIPDSGLVVLEGTGHYSYLDDYYKFRAVINAFFD